MTLIYSRRAGMARAGLLLAMLPGIAGCTAPAPTAIGTPPVAVVRPPAPAPITLAPITPAPGNQQNASGLDGNGKPVLFNDPPAPPDTPLCGKQAREVNAIATTLQGARVVASGICASFACYDPLTATYIGADGYRHVCR